MNLIKNRLLLLLLLISSFDTLAQVTPGRKKILFNRDWKFYKGDPLHAEQASFNDSGWRKLDLPHDFSIEGSFNANYPSCAGYLPGGTGWYRKSFSITAAEKNRKVFISFDGVYKNSEVWINGHYLGKCPSGYIAFEYDLTPWLKVGNGNIIVVKADHEDVTDSGWYTGSGIYRDVYLVYTDLVHIKQWGIFATAHDISENSATINARVELVNESKETGNVLLETILLDKQGRSVAGSNARIFVPAGGSETKELKMNITDPVLWSTERPNLYTLRTIIRSGNRIVDRQDTRVGIRYTRFDPDKGFFLNGKSMKMKGVCLVHDAGVLGAAVPRKVWEGRLDILKQLGCNAIRACHNPHSSDFLDLCDEKGFLVISEAYDEWEQPKTKWIDGWNQTKKVKNGYYKYFPEWGKKDLRDQILRDRNHPSIIMWSIGNEIDFPNDPYTHPSLDSSNNPQTFAKYLPGNPSAERLGVIAKELVRVVKEYDTSRVVTAGLASAFMSNQVGFAQQLDVVGYNYQEYLFADSHKKYPGQAFYSSENGHRLTYWEAVTSNDFVMGQFLWTGFEYLGESFKWPQRINPFGIIDLGGFFKAEAYHRQSLWSAKPMAFIGGWDTTVTEPTIYHLWDHKNALPQWNWRPGRVIRVSGFTNCEEMELFLNGRSLGVKKRAEEKDYVLNWYIPFEPGTIKAVARNGGREHANYELTTSGEPNTLVLNTNVSTLKADGRDVSTIDVYIKDEKGIGVYSAENLINVRTEGPVRLLGIENSNPTDTSNYKQDSHTAYKGRIRVYVQSLYKPGKAKVICTSPGLKEARLTLNLRR